MPDALSTARSARGHVKWRCEARRCAAAEDMQMQAGHVRENEDEEEEKGVMSIFKRKREGCSAATSNSIARSGQVPTSVRRLVKKKRSRIVGNKDTRTHACTHTHIHRWWW